MRVEFELFLKDATGGALKKFGGTARVVSDGVERDFKRVKKSIDDVGKGTKIKVDASEVRRAGDELEQLSRRMKSIRGGHGGGEGGGNISMGRLARGSFYGGLAARGVEEGIGAIKEIGGQAFGAGMDAEQQIIGLSTFLGKTRAKALYAQLQKDSALTPFTTAQILPGMLQLVASGQTPERSKNDLWALMNAESATGNAGNAFALELGESHLAQMASTGKADAYFMKEFQRTLHIPMTRLLAEELFPKNVKRGMKQIAAWSENGELKDHVTYDQFIGAMEKASHAGGMFAGALEAQSQTIKGKLSTIKDWWNIGLAKSILDPETHDNITKLEDRIIGGLQEFPELIANMSPSINRVFDEFEELWPSMKKFGKGMGELVEPVGGFAMSSEFKEMSKELLQLGGNLAATLKPTVQGLEGMGKALAGVFSIELGVANKLLEWRNQANGSIGALGAFATGGVPGLFGYAYDKFGPHEIHNKGTISGVKGLMGSKYRNQGMGWLMPGTAGDGSMKPASGAATDDSDAIVGGGKKQTIINVNAPMYQVNGGQHFEQVNDALNNMGPKVRAIFLRLLESANMAG